VSNEEGLPELSFKTAELPRKRWLGDAHHDGGLRQALKFGDADKICELRERHIISAWRRIGTVLDDMTRPV
jgi:hypothetical protein